MLNHPLEGSNESKIRCLDIHAMNKLYGTDPIFIWDPVNKSNRPVKGYHDNALTYWEIYPEFLKNFFVTAFTEGIKNPKKRIVEKGWKDAFVKLLNGITYCYQCGVENFFDEEKSVTGKTNVCWNCKKNLGTLLTIQIGKHSIKLNKETKILRHHIRDDYDLLEIEGEVVQNPANPAKWGIKNVSGDVWTYISKDGVQIQVDRGRTAQVSIGAKINFGSATGEFR